jgi:hypothetical protein
MTKIVIRDQLTIDGRGQVFVAHPDDNDGRDLRKLKGEQIEVDGQVYEVTAIETWAIETFVPRPVGLLVRPIRNITVQ